MPMNRVQFQRGLSFGELVRRCGTEEGCERELECQRWPEGFVCPSCGSQEYSNFRRERLLYCQCCACRHQASLIAGTVMASSRLGLRLWFQAAYPPLLKVAPGGCACHNNRPRARTWWSSA